MDGTLVIQEAHEDIGDTNNNRKEASHFSQRVDILLGDFTNKGNKKVERKIRGEVGRKVTWF